MELLLSAAIALTALDAMISTLWHIRWFVDYVRTKWHYQREEFGWHFHHLAELLGARVYSCTPESYEWLQ